MITVIIFLFIHVHNLIQINGMKNLIGFIKADWVIHVDTCCELSYIICCIIFLIKSYKYVFVIKCNNSDILSVFLSVHE